MPGPLYRMHGAMTGAYDMANVEVTNRVVLTNKMPAGLIRGFGGPQLYLALERLVQRIAVELGLDPLDVIRRNLVPAAKFPYRAAAGALYDSGDYRARRRDRGRRRAARRAEGAGATRRARRAALRHRLCRGGRAGDVQHGLSLDLADAARRASGRAQERRGVARDGHHRSAGRGVGDRRRHGAGPGPRHRAGADRRRGARPSRRRHRSRCSRSTPPRTPGRSPPAPIRAASRSGTAVAAHHGGGADARQARSHRAPSSSTCCPDDIEFAGGKIRSRSNPDNALPFGRVAGTAHWSPVMLPDDMAPALRETGCGRRRSSSRRRATTASTPR